jgi:hypothetical protein
MFVLAFLVGYRVAEGNGFCVISMWPAAAEFLIGCYLTQNVKVANTIETLCESQSPQCVKTQLLWMQARTPEQYLSTW